MMHQYMSKNEDFLRDAPACLYPLVKHIHSFTDDTKKIMFKESIHIGTRRGLHHVAYNDRLNDLYLNKGDFGAARLLYKLKRHCKHKQTILVLEVLMSLTITRPSVYYFFI